jgi:hypothetical protein
VTDAGDGAPLDDVDLPIDEPADDELADDELADDELDDDEDGGGPHDPMRFNHWMKRSATGAVLSGIALGLQQALEQKREVPAFIMEAPGEPEDPDAPITLRFDPDDPTKTVAVIRSVPRPTPTEHPDPGT